MTTDAGAQAAQDTQTITADTTTDKADLQAATTTPETAQTVDALPDWAQKTIKELRAENAKRRKTEQAAAKAAEDAAKKQAEEQGKFKELYETAQTQLAEARQQAQAAEVARMRARVGAKLQLPDVLIDRLQGDTAEELEADAKTLLEAMPKAEVSAKTDSRAGVNGKTPKAAMSPAEVREMAAIYGVSEYALKRSLGIE